MNILAVIPARGGSKGLPGKNIKPLDGKPLIAHTIEQGLACSKLTDVVVSTNDKGIRDVALEYGAKAPFLRPDDLATDTALSLPVVQHAVREMEERENKVYDVAVMLQPTSPLRKVEDIDNALAMLLETKADGVISVVSVDHFHPMKMKRFVDDRLVDYAKPPIENPPRQILPPVYIMNGAIYATRRDVLMERNTFQGDYCVGYIMPQQRSYDIDSEIDFIVAEYIIKNNTQD